MHVYVGSLQAGGRDKDMLLGRALAKVKRVNLLCSQQKTHLNQDRLLEGNVTLFASDVKSPALPGSRVRKKNDLGCPGPVVRTRQGDEATQSLIKQAHVIGQRREWQSS